MKTYANRVLRPVEVLLLVRYSADLGGRVLELGSGGGRLTGYLAEIATEAHGIDISAEMVAFAARTYPKATFSQGDLRDVATFGAGSFDAVVAGDNVLDVIDDAARGRVLDGIHQVLPPGGLLILSSHNLAHPPRLRDELSVPDAGLFRAALSLVKLPSWLINQRRLLRYERFEPGYSILNDISHDFMGLNYYISRDAQEAQLTAHGFDYIESLDQDGHRVERGDDAPGAPWLHYVARRGPDEAA